MKTHHHLLATTGLGLAVAAAGHQINEALIIGSLMGGVFIDFIDHGIYTLATVRPLRPLAIMEYHRKEYNKHQPHFYLFHTFETMAVISVIMSRFEWGGIFMINYLVHLALDAGTYMKKRSDHYWLKKWFIIYNVKELRDNRRRIRAESSGQD